MLNIKSAFYKVQSVNEKITVCDPCLNEKEANRDPS